MEHLLCFRLPANSDMSVSPSFVFRTCQLDYCFSTYPDDALNPPCIVASATTRVNMRTTPATSSATATPTYVTVSSTTGNAATTMTPSGVARPLSSFVFVRPRQLYTHHEWTPYALSMFVSHQKDRDELKTDAMLHGVFSFALEKGVHPLSLLVEKVTNGHHT